MCVPSICRPVPSDKGVTLADTLKWDSAKGSSAKRHPCKGQERNSAPCSADRNQIPCICPERQHEKYKLRDFFSEACTHAENLCAALYGVFLCRSVAFSRGAERVAYKGVQCAEMLRNVEVFKKLLLIFELQDFWTILSDSFSGFSEK